MIERCTEVIVDWLIKCEAVEDIEKELYSYALYSLLLSLLPLVLAIGFGLCLGCVRQSVTIIVPFAIIRKFSGGYHTKHSWSCLLWSCLLMLLCIVVSCYVQWGLGLIVVTIGSAVSLIVFSPIDNENRVLSPDERVLYKKVTVILVIIFLLLDVILFLLHLNTYAVCISIGIMLSAGLQLPNVWKNFMKK